MRANVAALVLVLSTFLLSVPAHAKRIALVIGNDDYTTLPKLNNAATDARGMAAKLKQLGFEVILKTNAGRRDMHRAIGEFSSRLAAEDEALVFYAGHGIQADGQNFLIPSNAQVEIEDDLRSEALTANDFLGAMADARVKLSMLILDACRDNPLPKRKRSAARGLSIVSVPQGASGSAVIYSAAPGQTAEDGPKGGHGVFTGELLKAMDRPGLTLEQMFKQTVRGVASKTRNKQKPWMNASLTGDFYFRSGATTAPRPTPPVTGGSNAEVVFWQSIEDSKRAGDFQAYLDQFPNGTFRGLAESRLNALKKSQTASLTPPKAVISVTPLDQEMWATKTVNVRSAPTARSDKLSRLNAGEKIDVTGRAEADGGTWLRVALAGGQVGYVFGPLLKDKQPSPNVQPAVGTYFPPGKVFRDCGDCPEMVVIPSGSFRMGDLSGGGEDDEKPVRTVTIPKPFAVGKYEVTQAEWGWVMGTNPSRFKGDRNPVENVSWGAAKEFVRKLNQKTGKQYRLLSEAEWEYAARAGTGTKYHCGSSDGCLGSVAWFNGNSGSRTHAVGGKGGNAFGLHDMHGNVFEWVEDCWNKTYAGAPMGGTAWTSGDCSQRVLRGGSWGGKPGVLRSANRNGDGTDFRYYSLGFRVARTL